MKSRCVLLALFIFCDVGRAFTIPQGLSDSDRHEVVRTLGLNTATKMLNNPYPLGGYSGFEVGWALEFIDISDLRRLGCTPGSANCGNTTTNSETEWRYSRISIAKGIYENIDIFFQFIPPAGAVNVSDYGGGARWSFYQARFLPINVSVIGYFDQLNYEDVFVNRNIGADIQVGVNVENFALYFGGGYVQGSGVFSSTVAQSGDLDPNSNTVNDQVALIHTVVGISLHYEDLFAAAEVDRYQDAVYSLKAGLRF